MSYSNGEGVHEMEVYVDSTRATVDELGIEGIDPKLKNEISFRWAGDALEGASAEALAAAIATLTGGVIWENSEGVIISVETAVEYATSCVVPNKCFAEIDATRGWHRGEVGRYLRCTDRAANTAARRPDTIDWLAHGFGWTSSAGEGASLKPI
jgi:hypothetical protein